MPFIYKDKDIRDRRVNLFIKTLHKAFTNLLLLEKEAQDLIDEDTEKAYIASLSDVDGETNPILPFGDELIFQFNSLGFNFDSDSKFIVEEHEGQTLLDVLEVQYATEGESLASGTIRLSNGLLIRDGEIIFKNLELYDYDYQSFEILNEIYRALEIFFASVETFYANFFVDEIEETNTSVLVYDMSAYDAELNDVVFPAADTISDATNRETVKQHYRVLRDRIEFWAMARATRFDEYIDQLLFCINGSKKYSIQQNIETKQLELIVDENGYSRRLHKDEEVFFPFHNKPTLNEFIEGIRGKY